MDRRLALIDELVVRFNSGDLAHFVELLHPAVEVRSELMANPGTHSGREGYLVWAQHWMEAWSDQHVRLAQEPELIGDDEALALAHQTARGAGSAIEVEMLVGYRLAFAGDLITRFHVFEP